MWRLNPYSSWHSSQGSLTISVHLHSDSCVSSDRWDCSLPPSSLHIRHILSRSLSHSLPLSPSLAHVHAHTHTAGASTHTVLTHVHTLGNDALSVARDHQISSAIAARREQNPKWQLVVVVVVVCLWKGGYDGPLHLHFHLPTLEGKTPWEEWREDEASTRRDYNLVHPLCWVCLLLRRRH